MANRGEISKATVKKWEEHTPKDKPLPEKVEKEASVKSHLIAGGVGATLGATGMGYLGIRHGEKQRHLGQLQAANYLLAGPHGQSIRNTTLTPEDIEGARTQGQYEERYMNGHTEKSAFVVGFEKKANFAHAAELAGLGILAAPATHELANKEQADKFWTPRKKAIADVAGLGVLAAPSIAHFASKL